VVDEKGRCIGVISTTDLVRFMDQGLSAARRPIPSGSCFCLEWEVVDIDSLPLDDVARYMTTNVVTASPSTPMGQLAQIMIDAHIHRVVVVDAEKRALGVVSTTNILAAVAAEDRLEHDNTLTGESGFPA
jgi:CBS-domain-containing membrane protein